MSDLPFHQPSFPIIPVQMITGVPFVEFAPSDGDGGYRRIDGHSSSPHVNRYHRERAWREGRHHFADSALHIDTAGFVESCELTAEAARHMAGVIAGPFAASVAQAADAIRSQVERDFFAASNWTSGIDNSISTPAESQPWNAESHPILDMQRAMARLAHVNSIGNAGLRRLREQAAELGITFLAPDPRFGIVAAFEERYQREATAREREILLGHSPAEREAMAAQLRPLESYPAEQRVDAETKKRTKAAEVEALIAEFEPEL